MHALEADSVTPRPADDFACPVCGPAAASRPPRVRAVHAGFIVVTCPTCEVEWQWPRPTPGALARLYTQEYYDAWGLREDEAVVRAMKLSTFDRLLARVEQHTRPGALLDVGCATGFLLEAAQRRGWDPYGVEISAYGSTVARQRFGATHIMNTRLEDAAFPDRFFSAVTMTDLIEHVLDPVGTLTVAHRLLRPEGIVCITTPHVGCLSYVLMGRRWTQYKLEHLQYYRPEAMRRLLSTAGFRVVECRAWPKTVTLEYVRTQFARYRHWLISPAVQLVSAALPRSLRARALSVPLGDMLVVAVRHG